MLSGLGAALWASVLAGTVATTVGALPIAVLPRPGEIGRRRLTGFAAGIMLAASVFSLAVPALELRVSAWGPSPWTLVAAALAFLAGAVFVDGLNHVVPHEHFVTGPEGLGAAEHRGLWLLVLAMTLHNLPEGMAVGVGSALEGPMATSVALAVGLQNVPEGLVVAAALLDKGYSRRFAIFVAFASGAVEPVGALFGYGVVALAAPLLPGALLFSAGAMVYVVAHEVLPESHVGEVTRDATWATLVGFTLMMVLDNALG